MSGSKGAPTCSVCIFIAQYGGQGLTRREIENAVDNKDEFSPTGRCPNHPLECFRCKNEVFNAYALDVVVKALGRNGGTPLPKNCEECNISSKTGTHSSKKKVSHKEVEDDLYKVSHNLGKLSFKDAGPGGSGKNLKPSPEKTPPPPPRLPAVLSAEQIEKSERRKKGQRVSSPTERNGLLPVYCGGGKMCGLSIDYTLTHRPTHCTNNPKHVVNWSEMRCVHCRSTWVENRDGIGSNSKILTHHVCLSCGCGLHGGVCNHYGIMIH